MPLRLTLTVRYLPGLLCPGSGKSLFLDTISQLLKEHLLCVQMIDATGYAKEIVTDCLGSFFFLTSIDPDFHLMLVFYQEIEC